MSRLTKKFADKVVLPVIPMEIKSKEDLDKFHEVRREYEAMAIKLAEYEDKEEVGVATEGTIKFLESLIEDMSDMDWTISEIVEIEKFNRDDKEYCKIKGDRFSETYEKQNDEYIVQWTGYCEDDFHGIILKPLKDDKYLKISYSC